MDFRLKVFYTVANRLSLQKRNGIIHYTTCDFKAYSELEENTIKSS
jgi:hypothetical protein